MSAAIETSAPAVDDLEAAAQQAIAASGGDPRETVKALLIAVDFLEAQVDELRGAVSSGYARRQYKPSRDRKE